MKHFPFCSVYINVNHFSTVEDVTDAEESKNESPNHTFLLQVLLEALCGTLERDAEKRFQLFNGMHVSIQY